MPLNKELEEELNLVKTITITVLIGDGHEANGFYVNDTNLFHRKFIDTLNKINEEVTIDKLKDLTIKNEKANEAIYLLMSNYKMLTSTIETLKDFNMRYAHYFTELSKFLEKNNNG